ncbi:hypothetical protein F4780DRAFT_777605 [Xylariomycetidae sp. FL0641]|nr:hypothetical protein F4780DRAFT_777605 [Xylariomycetidae sp. FL0641]
MATSYAEPQGQREDHDPTADNVATENELQRTESVRTIGIFKLRGKTDDLPQSWWFASTAVPLLAATQGPLSNVLSIAALATAWRVDLPNNGQLPEGADANGMPLKDPNWELALNGVSLACGFAGNLLLLLHFVGRVRYIIALPFSILFWTLASGILIAVTASVSIHIPAVPPGQTYSQGFWHAVLASITYMFGAGMLMANLLGYLFGHYPQNFVLDDDQRTLILQTMMFFIWLAGGAGVFSQLEGWTFANALYYCDVLGLVISRISRYMTSLSADKVIKKHQLRARENTLERTVTNENELRERLGLPPKRKATIGQQLSRQDTLTKYGRFHLDGNTVTFHERKPPARHHGNDASGHERHPSVFREPSLDRYLGKATRKLRLSRREKLLVLKEERDRFNAMRRIQDQTRRFKQYYALTVSILAFGLLWVLGALVFMYAEARMQNLTYYDSFYFCFVTLLTVGYGDLSPESNVGKAFFIVWSLIAVPSITVLIQVLSDTVVAGFNRATNVLLPEKGFLQAFLDSHPAHWMTRVIEGRILQKRVEAGFQVQDPDEPAVADASNPHKGIDEEQSNAGILDRARKGSLSEHQFAHQLAHAIRSVARDLQADPPKRYSFEEWAYFTRLIRFSSSDTNGDAAETCEEGEALVEWDWIGEDSPMLADSTESEWVLDRLCESLNRYTRWTSKRHEKSHKNTPQHKHPAAVDEIGEAG